MKKLTLCLTLAAIFAANAAWAEEDLDRAVSSICEYTKANDRASLRRKLDENRIELRHSYEDIRCAKQSLLRTAAAAGAVDSATLIVTKVGRRAVAEAEEDGQTALQWTQKRYDSADAAGKTKIKPVLDLMHAKL